MFEDRGVGRIAQTLGEFSVVENAWAEVAANLEKSTGNDTLDVATWPARSGIANVQYRTTESGVRWEAYLTDRSEEGCIRRAASRDRTGLGAAESEAVEAFECLEGPVDCTPSGALAEALAKLDLETVSDYGLVETVADWNRIIAWAQGHQLAAVGELAAREAMNPVMEYNTDHDACIVAEELALRLHCTRQAGRQMAEMAIAFDGWLAPTAAALKSGDIDLPRARIFHQALSKESGGATPLAALTVQDAVLPIAAERTPPQLARDVQRAVLLADPESAEATHQAALNNRRVCRPRILPGGMAGTWIVLSAIDAMRLDVALDGFARATKSDGDSRTIDQLRADAIADWASRALAGLDPVTPQFGGGDTGECCHGGATKQSGESKYGSPKDAAAELGGGNGVSESENGVSESENGVSAREGDAIPPSCAPAPLRPFSRVTNRSQIRVTVPLDVLLGESYEPAELAGYGPITPNAARAIARDGVWRRIVTDPMSGAVRDVGRTRYRPPPDLAEYVRCRDGTCVRPGCGVRADNAELDHTVEWQHGGPTSAANLAPLCTRDHQIKTNGGFVVQQVQPGEFKWQTPTGHVVQFRSQAEIDRLIARMVEAERPLVDADLRGMLDGSESAAKDDEPPF